ncbi:MAG: Rpn family recombination-promoting nuclease/putative transposase, partial [Desulfovibrionaceae bacterium]|nr:Rpn family recombination-promoting nuclease/putative transposase [Desulfovibrionaceae bacterium]
LDIEMQTTSNLHLYKRFQYTTCKLYVEQIASGEDYSLLKKSFTIVIYSVNHIKDKSCHHKFVLYDKSSDLEYEDSIEIHTLEIKKRKYLLKNKSPEEVKKLKPLFQWLEFLASKTEEDYMEAANGNPVMENALNQIRIMSRSKEERAIAEAVDLAKGDLKAMYRSGEDNGIRKENRRIVKNMLRKNFDISLIKDVTGLSDEEIKKIRV